MLQSALALVVAVAAAGVAAGPVEFARYAVTTTAASASSGGKPSQCTYTQHVPLTPNFGPTLTAWTTTETVTSKVDCSGCASLKTTVLDFLNPGPVVFFDTTSTAESASKETKYVCEKSHHHSQDDSAKPTPTPSMTSSS